MHCLRAYALTALTGLTLAIASTPAQQPLTAAAVEQSSRQPVPSLVPFAGSLAGAAGEKIVVHLSLYAAQDGANPLWSEEQLVAIGTKGEFTVLLGAASAIGLPQTLFSSGEPRWLGVSVDGREVSRSLLTSVPYAMKSADAARLDGLPAESFVTQDQLAATLSSLQPQPSSAAGPQIAATVTGNGTAGYLPTWTGSATLGSSVLYQTGSGASAKLGVGTTTPTAALDVNGAANLRSEVDLLATPATAATATSSPALKLGASSYLAGSGPVAQNFVWQARSAGNNTATPSANLALLFGAGSAAPAATGFSITPNGVINFSPNQTFPIKGTAGGTITAVTPGTGLKGGGTSGNVTLSLDPAKAPLLSTFNTFASGASFGGESWWNGNSGDWMMAVTNTATAAKGVILGQAQGSVTAIEGASPAGEAISGLTTTGTAVVGQAYGEGGAAYFWSQAAKAPAVLVHAAGASNDGFDVTSVGGIGVSARSTSGNAITAVSNSGNGIAATSGNGFGGIFTNNSTYQATVYAVNNGLGNAGYFGSSGPGRVSLAGVNSSTDPNAVATYGSVANGKAIFGTAPAGIGVYGVTSTGTGVSAVADTGTGIQVTTTGSLSTGIMVNSSWTGIHAQLLGPSWAANRVGGVPSIWGDSGTGAGIGVAATNGDGVAALVLNNSSGYTALSVYNYGSGGGTHSNFDAMAAGTPDGICGIGGAGSLTCTGPVKSLVATSDARQVETYAVQSSENWMEDYGSGQLTGGRAVVRIDPAFARVVNSGVEYHVFLTPNGDCKGLYVDHKTAEGFQVHELGGGSSQIAFDYKIVAKRTGHETERLNDVTESFHRETRQLEHSRLSPEAPAVLSLRK